MLLILKVLEGLLLYHPKSEIQIGDIGEVFSEDEIIKLRKELRERIIEIEGMSKH